MRVVVMFILFLLVLAFFRGVEIVKLSAGLSTSLKSRRRSDELLQLLFGW
jgi:hypothetical protein